VDRDRLRNGASSATTTLDHDTLLSELEAAQKTVRMLLREMDKAQRRYDDLHRAYKMTVDNLVKTSGECSMLERERDQWKQRAEQRYEQESQLQTPIPTKLSPEEIAAIRKAMARLHHPDTGGNAERMKAWNALLDKLEQE
jgi:hypothetical protein